MLCNILIIDSRKELSTKYKKSLLDSDTSVDIASDMKKVYVYIQSKEPDLIIVSDSIKEDINNFCSRIRVLTYNIRPIIVVLSKSENLDDKIAVLEAGADDFISEPVNIKEFKTRIKAHLRRELESNLDNKTLLPNQNYSIRAIKRMLVDSKDWACVLINIVNFKEYVDVYTDFAGDRVLQTLIAIIKSTVQESDFISQISEHEIFVITNSYIVEKLASFLTVAFDSIVAKFYSHDDTKRGYMLSHGDDEAELKVEFLKLLITVVSSEFDNYTNPMHVLQKLKRIKYLANVRNKSNYIIDRPKLTGESVTNVNTSKKIILIEEDDSLQLLLRTSLELQGYDVFTEINDEIIPEIFIIDSGENLKNLKLCTILKSKDIYSNSKIVVTSNVHDKNNILNSGADLYLPKPYELTSVIKWVNYLLRE